MKNIPYGKQFISEEDVKVVIEALHADFLTQGPKVAEFEKAYADYIGCKYAVAVSNGTAALHLSALALNVKPGQKVITTPITFVASANCVRYCGGEIAFADINPNTYLLDIEEVRKLLKKSPKGTYSGIIPVDLAGNPVNMEEFKKLADEYDLWIIEDACHAPGGYFIDSKNKKQFCGNGSYADLAIFSFHPVKHIACGEGGMITTNDRNLYEKLLVLRTHGITRNKDDFKNEMTLASGNADFDKLNNQGFDKLSNQDYDKLSQQVVTAPDNITSYPGWYMEMQELGFNYRLTDFQSALGISQLKRADEGLKKRREIAKKYADSFKGKDWLIGQSGFDKSQSLGVVEGRSLSVVEGWSLSGVEGHAYHLYIIETKDRLGLYNFLRNKNIFAQVHYIPAHLMPYYKEFGFKPGDFPKAESYYSQCLSLPMFPTLTAEEQDYVIENINNYFSK